MSLKTAILGKNTHETSRKEKDAAIKKGGIKGALTSAIYGAGMARSDAKKARRASKAAQAQSRRDAAAAALKSRYARAPSATRSV